MPWLLSLVWRWQPLFPANVETAVWMTAFFSCWYLVAAFLLLRRFSGSNDLLALAVVGVTAFHPLFVAVSGAVLSDLPFAALAMMAAVAAEAAMRREGRAGMAALAAMFTGLAILTRTLGVAVASGILAAALHRRAYRQATIFCLVLAPFLFFVLPRGGAEASAASEPGWRQTWIYYSSYGQFWKLSVPNFRVFREMAAVNIRNFLEMPATFCLFPPPGGEQSHLGVMLCITLTIGILAGMARQARRQWQPIHFIFVFYS
ncbi:MAG: hypothetical protein HY236_10185, partial [Acidobacteria bacterium]|nr:hypothetical protein [Acidobacteriota bacterium]